MTDRMIHDGVLILGAGLAGLAAALAAAPRRALVLTPASLAGASASAWAQGGVAAALSAGDDPELHAADTIAAGAGLTDPDIAHLLACEGPDAVRWLADLGAPFDRDASGGFSQGLEAAHSRPRIARVKGDQAGRAVMQAMSAAALRHGHIQVREGAAARALLQDASGRVIGALVEADGRLAEILAPAVVLAAGGLGGLYAVTTNPAAALGEGLALAALAGATVGDPEFVQFHPTAIDVGRDPAPLATEALRGEGARLVDRDGRPFMADYDPREELAPRDIVARAIHSQRAAGRGAYLDARAAVGVEFPEAFPTVFAACMAAGLDPRERPIPVAPAAHYHMGGAATDAQGRTSLESLYAAGECACTGVHGANRLASNSLLEAAVFGRRAGAHAREARLPTGAPEPVAPPPVLPEEALQSLRREMSRAAGVVRDRAGLSGVLDLVLSLERAHGPALPLVAARLIAACALAREESRGAHFRADHPEAGSPPRRTFTTLAEIDRRLTPEAAE
jgi:L-aspartate oxidase